MCMKSKSIVIIIASQLALFEREAGGIVEMVCFMVVAVVVADESEAKNVNKVSHLCCVLKSLTTKV